MDVLDSNPGAKMVASNVLLDKKADSPSTSSYAYVMSSVEIMHI